MCLFNSCQHLVNISSGNGLVSSDKPLPEPMLAQIYVIKIITTWSHTRLSFYTLSVNPNSTVKLANANKSLFQSVNMLRTGSWSLSDNNWEKPRGCPCLSKLNYWKNQCMSDKTVILNALTVNAGSFPANVQISTTMGIMWCNKAHQQWGFAIMPLTSIAPWGW